MNFNQQNQEHGDVVIFHVMGYLTKNMMLVFSTNGRFHKWWGWFNHEKSQKNVFHMAIQHERPRDFVTFFVEVNLGKL